MGFQFAAVRSPAAEDDAFLPRVDAAGAVAWHEADGARETFAVTGLTIYRGKVAAGARVAEWEKVPLAVHVSEARLVAVGSRADNDGARLVGQLRWTWLAELGYTERATRRSSGQLRLVVKDGATDEWLFIDFELARSETPRTVAELVLGAAAASRDERPVLPRYAGGGRFAIARIPGARTVVAPEPGCPACGGPLAAGARFCRSCGHRLSG